MKKIRNSTNRLKDIISITKFLKNEIQKLVSEKDSSAIYLLLQIIVVTCLGYFKNRIDSVTSLIYKYKNTFR